MNATLSTTAWVLHDLGLATSVGGSLFGKAGLHPAVRTIESADERGRITSAAWKEFAPINLASHATVLLTWLAGRSVLTGRTIDSTTRDIVYAKDALIGTFFLTGLGSAATGYMVSKLKDDGSHATASSDEMTATKQERCRKLQRLSSMLGYANLVAGAAVLGLTAVLSMKAGRSAKWSLASRLLP